MNIFAGMDPSAEQHGNEHDLPRPEVRHVDSFEEMPQTLVLQKFAIEEFRRSLDSVTSSDQLVEIFIHGVLSSNGSNRDASNKHAAIRSWCSGCNATTPLKPVRGDMRMGELTPNNRAEQQL
jgi:hypothetical protein